MRVPRLVQWVLKYVTPLYLIAIFVGICYTQAGSYWDTLAAGGVPLYSVMFIGGVFGFLLLLTHIAGKRWEQEGRIKYIKN
jgi:hypothetical protein